MAAVPFLLHRVATHPLARRLRTAAFVDDTMVSQTESRASYVTTISSTLTRVVSAVTRIISCRNQD